MSERLAPQPFEANWEESIALLDSLPTLAADERIEAIETLIRNPSPGFLSRTLRMAAAVLPDERVKFYLRSDGDDVLRNAGVEILKIRGHRGFSLTLHLLKDSDSDVALQAVIVLKHLRDPRALEPLRSLLHHPDPNVIQEAIVAIGELGDARAIPDLLAFLDSDSWFQMAAVEALGNLRSPVSIPHLANLLTDLMTGPLAAEALARIGGFPAFGALAGHWLEYRHESDAETALGLLAHVLEGLPEPPTIPDGFDSTLLEFAEDSNDDIRQAVARCLLVIGNHDPAVDHRALTEISRSQTEYAVLPACLHQRQDLIEELISRSGAERAWGFLLAARYPRSAPIPAIVAALGRPPLPSHLPAILRALEKIDSPEITNSLIGFYLCLPDESRAELHGLMFDRKDQLRQLIDRDIDVDQPTLIVLLALVGSPTREIYDALTRLPTDDRVRALRELVDLEDLMRSLPWQQWLEQEPEAYAEAAADFAARAGLRELAPLFRAQLESSPAAFLIRTLGELGDRESVPILVSLLEQSGDLDALILESLGQIGGPSARQTLRREIERGDQQRQRIAYRALAQCATEDDESVFRAAGSHQDWYVRLSCVDVLRRFSRPKNLATLAQLASDPIPIVAQRALACLEA